MPRLRQDLVARQERDGFVTVAEASRRSGVCERTIRSWTRSGTLRTRRVGPMLVFVDVVSLAEATGIAAGGSDDDEILNELRSPAPPPAASRTVRELTLERDE